MYLGNFTWARGIARILHRPSKSGFAGSNSKNLRFFWVSIKGNLDRRFFDGNLPLSANYYSVNCIADASLSTPARRRRSAFGTSRFAHLCLQCTGRLMQKFCQRQNFYMRAVAPKVKNLHFNFRQPKIKIIGNTIPSKKRLCITHIF